MVKNLPANVGGMGGFEPWAGKHPWRRVWQPFYYSCPENSRDRGGLAGKESDKT